MSQDAAAGTITAEAAAAASEAAREARAEAFEQAAPQESRPARTREQGKAKAPAKDDPWHRFVIDVWITNLNSVEFGIYKKSRNKAKSRQFTTDMDVFAEVIEDGERTGVLSYREDLWKKSTGLDKRLVLKLFTDSLNWRATMDLMIGRSLQQTLGARGLPVVAYSINTNDDDYIIYVERSANKWPLLPENFSFFIMDEGRPRFYRLKRDLIDLGGDYTLLDEKNQVVGHLDGHVLTIGGYWKGRVRKGTADKKLLTAMKLFCGMIIFNGPVRRHVKRLWREVTAGRLSPKLERQEADLYMNPRRVR